MKKNRFLAIKFFIIFWVMSLMILWILPIQSKFKNEFESVLLISSFVIIVSVVAVFWYCGTRTIRVKSQYPKEISRKKIRFIIYYSSFSTIVGNAFLYIDRVFFRGIDYSRGFRDARYQWDSSTIPGSIFSKIGNLMIPFSYCALFMGVFHWELLNKKQRFIALMAGFGGQFGIAMLNGGRSNILMSIIFAFVVCMLRKYMGNPFFPKFQGRIIWVSIGFVAVLSYVSAILYAFTGNDLLYLQLSVDGGGAKLMPGYQDNPAINFIIEIALYLLHGIYYISAVISSNPSFADLNHNISLRGIFVLMARTPLLSSYNMELPNFDGGNGNFIALPGILLYDYGYIGFFVACILLGIMSGTTLKIINRSNYDLWELVIVLFVLIHLYMSMVTVAFSFGYFLFMIFAMVSMEMISGIKYGKSGWVKVQDEM